MRQWTIPTVLLRPEHADDDEVDEISTENQARQARAL